MTAIKALICIREVLRRIAALAATEAYCGIYCYLCEVLRLEICSCTIPDLKSKQHVHKRLRAQNETLLCGYFVAGGGAVVVLLFINNLWFRSCHSLPGRSQLPEYKLL
jgi:hypothetical protein